MSTRPCTFTADGWLRDTSDVCRVDDHGTPTRHCQTRRHCGRHLTPGEYACPRCISGIRSDLERIEIEASLMHVEAIFAGVDSEAVNLAGPATNPVLWKWRQANVIRTAWLEGADFETRSRLRDHYAPDMLHPITCLGYWEHLLREDLGHDHTTPVSPTLSGSRRYLDWILTDLARDEDRAPVLADLARDVRRCLTHMEAVRHDSNDADKGVPCTHCVNDETGKGPALVKVWQTRAAGETYSPDTPGNWLDRWECPRCRRTWSDEDYHRHVDWWHLTNAPWLTAEQIESTWRVKASTVRTWAQRGFVPKRRRDGRLEYEVAAVKTQRDTPDGETVA